MKSQTIRALDVVAIGPLMIYFGARAKGISPALMATMFILGVTTIVYNGRNYLEVEKRKR